MIAALLALVGLGALDVLTRHLGKRVDRAGLSWPHNANWKKR